MRSGDILVSLIELSVEDDGISDDSGCKDVFNDKSRDVVFVSDEVDNSLPRNKNGFDFTLSGKKSYGTTIRPT